MFYAVELLGDLDLLLMISSLLSVNAKEGSFEQVAKKLARRFVTRERRIKSYRQEINDLCIGRISPSPGMTVPLSQPSQQQAPRKAVIKVSFVLLTPLSH
ncbi:hypothetical protein ACTXT7_015443 [Hymenolepis weldensis]